MSLFESEPTLDDPRLEPYLKLGIPEELAARYLDAGVPASFAAKGERYRVEYPDMTFDEVVREYAKAQRQREEEKAIQRLIADLPKLASSNAPISHEEACAIVAYDDELFWACNNHIGTPDEFEDNSAIAARLLNLIQRAHPEGHSPLYRGESTIRVGGEHTRGFHSWTVARDIAEGFFKDTLRGTGRLYRLTEPVKGIDLGHVGLWRGRLSGESHYMGAQGEWLVLDGYRAELIAEK